MIFEFSDQVLVVWEKWGSIPHDERAKMVVAAYQNVEERGGTEGLQAAGIFLTFAVTPGEAIDMNLLPYSVMSNIPRKHPNFDAVQSLKLREGAIETSAGLELRFPTRYLARQAYERLKKDSSVSLPEVHWQIGQQVGSDLDLRWRTEGAGS